MKSIVVLTCIVLSVTGGVLLSINATEQPGIPSIPIADLPDYVDAPDGKLTMFADFKHAGEKGVPLFIVNRTGKAIRLPVQDGDFYAKLEMQTKDGRWVRAQSHVFSWCGNSYFRVEIKPGRFVRLDGWQPKAGEKRQVRFQLYSSVSLTSNVGTGLVSQTERRKAETDSMSVRTGDVALMERVLFKTPDAAQRTRDAAIDRLGGLPANKSLPVLVRLLESKDRLNESELDRVLESLRKVDSDRMQSYAKECLTSGPADRRLAILKSWHVVPKPQELQQTMIKHLKSMEPESLRIAMARLAGRRVPAMKSLLAEIEADRKYPDDLRIAARFERERWFGGKGVDLKISYGFRRWRLSGPLMLEVRMVNRTKQTIAFDYASPSEFVSLYVQAHGRYIAPRKGVAWFTPVKSGKRKKVLLKPGEAYEFQIDVLDYFDRSFVREDTMSLRVSISCQIPGIHSVPQLNPEGFRVPINHEH